MIPQTRLVSLNNVLFCSLPDFRLSIESINLRALAGEPVDKPSLPASCILRVTSEHKLSILTSNKDRGMIFNGFHHCADKF